MTDLTEKEHDIQWALDLLSSDHRDPPYFFDRWQELIGGLCGLGASFYRNYAMTRPPYAGIQAHVAFTLGGLGLGYFGGQQLRKYTARRDAIYRDYIRLHPEDFPPPERKLWRDAFIQWVPAR